MNEDFWAAFPVIADFDCVAMKLEIQARIHDETKDMSPHEVLAYFERRALDAAKLRESGQANLLLMREEPENYSQP
jgi:hypothetical protein